MTTTTFIPGNNVNTTLAAATPASGAGSTTFTLASSTNLPTLSGGAQMPLTLNDAATGGIYEIVYVTAITGATLTVLRAQEGTTAQSWNIGDFAFCAPTAGTVAQIDGNPAQQFQVAAATAVNQAPQTGQLQTSSVSYAVGTGTANAHTIALAPALTARTDGMLLRYKAPAANTGAVTLTDGVGTVAVIGSAHAALQGGEYIANGDALVVWNSTINSGTYILLECTGGALQVSPATQSQHAVQVQQVPAVVGEMREIRANVTSNIFSVVINEVGVKTAVSGVGSILSGISGLTFSPAASNGIGGMDTGAAPASAFVVVYLMYAPGLPISGTNPGLMGQIETGAIATDTYTGGSRPTGYTQSALVAILPTNSSNALITITQRGRVISQPPVTVLTSTASQPAYAALTVTTAIPKSASRAKGSVTAGNSTATATTVVHVAASAAGVGEKLIAGNGSAVGEFDIAISSSQQIFWENNVSAGAASQTIAISEYEFEV